MIEVTATHDADHAVGIVRFADGERNHLSPELVLRIAEATQSLEQQGSRAVVLTTPSKHFCAGADFGGDNPGESRAKRSSSPIYDVVPRLFDRRIPVIAVVNGASIGGGLGLAMSADFRVAGPRARFAANFAQIGMSPGFGLTFTLPRAIGHLEASRLLYTGRRIDGVEATRIRLCESVSETPEEADESALALAREIASSAPLALHGIHALLNPGLPEQIETTLRTEHSVQRGLYATADFDEGVAAARDRRTPRFTGR